MEIQIGTTGEYKIIGSIFGNIPIRYITYYEFAWLPKRTVYGTWVWLKTVKVVLKHYINGYDIEYYTPKEYTFAAIKGEFE